MKLDYQDIVNRLNDQAETIAFDLLEGARKDGKYIRGDCHGKCSVHASGAKVGLVGFWQGQRPSSSGGNLIHLIEIAMGMGTHGEAVRYAKRKYLGIGEEELTDEQKRNWAKSKREAEVKSSQRRADGEREEQDRVGQARGIWSEARPIEGTLGEVYLVSRVNGLKSDDLKRYKSLRFHPALSMDGRDKHPCLIGAVQSPTRDIRAIWRIFLAPGGEALRDEDGAKVKLGFGPASGSAVRLGPQRDHLHLCEGIETGFGIVMMLGGPDAERSVWPCLSTSGLIGFTPPDGVKSITIWSDGDRYRRNRKTGEIDLPPGAKAAGLAREKFKDKGIRVDIAEPPENSDWLDVWNTNYELNQYG